MPNNRGFAIALDALMAIILVTALLVFLSQQPDLPSPGIDTSKRLKEITHNAFATLENSGILGDYLVERVFDANSARDINREAKKLVPGNVDLKVKITAFQATTDMAYCRNQQRFETCFDTPNAIVSMAGKEPPPGKEVVYGKKILAIRQPGGETKGPSGEILCTMQGELAPKKTKKPFSYAWFDENTASIEFQAYAHSNSMACASTMPPTGGPPDNPPGRVAEYSTVTLKARNQTRDPLDVYLILDKSGSMETYDMQISSSKVTGVPASGGKCNTGNPDQNNACTSVSDYQTNCGWPNPPASHPACGTLPSSLPNYTNWQTLGATFDLNQQIVNLLKGPDSLLFFILTPQRYWPALRLGYCGTNTGEPNGTLTCYNDFPPFIQALQNGIQAGGYPNHYNYGGYTYFGKGGIAPGNTFAISAWNDQSEPTYDAPLDGYLRADSRNDSIGAVNVPVPQAEESTGPFQDSDFNLVARIQIPDGGAIPTGTITVGMDSYTFSDYIPAINRLMGMNIALAWNSDQYPSVGRGFAVRNRYTGPGLEPDPNVANPPGDYAGDRKCDDGHCVIIGYCSAGSCPYGYFMQPREAGDTGAMPCIGGNLNVSPNNKSKNQSASYCINQGAGDGGDYTGRLPPGTYDILLATDTAFDAGAISVKLSLYQFVAELGTLSSTGGKCNGQDCSFSVNSQTNCPVPPQDNGPNCLYIPGNESCTSTQETVVKQFTVFSEDYYRGIVIKPKMYNYTGSCDYATFGVRYPSGSSIPVKLMDVRAVPQNGATGFQTEFGLNAKSIHPGRNQTITTPIPIGVYEVFGWAPTTAGPALMDVNFYEQRIDAAQYAASNFIDNNNWKFEDTIGTITFSNGADELRSLLHMDDINREILKGDMDGIAVNGETNIYSSISLARSRLSDIGKNSRQFIILLSDGLANLPPPPQDPLQLAIGEARDAYDFDHVVTYTIAFGMDAIDWNAQVGAWQCKQPLTLIAIAGGGKCYPANDPQQLVEIYNLIANQIQQQLGKTDLEMPLYLGQWIDSPECNPEEECGLDPNPDCPQGIYLRRHTNWEPETFDDFCWPSVGNWYQAGSNESIVFKDILINQIGDWWDANFSVAWPCGGEHCFEEMTFPLTNDLEPRKGTKVTITDLPIVPWPADDNSGFPEQQTISIRTKDLGAKFLDGNIFSNKTNLRVRLQNLQDLNINLNGHQENLCPIGQIEARFFRNTSPEPPDFNQTPALSTCVNPDANSDGIMIPLEFKDFMEQIQNGEGGYIFVEINPNRGTNPIFQCKDNDYDKIFCFAEPAIKYFLLEYWSWLK